MSPRRFALFIAVLCVLGFPAAAESLNYIGFFNLGLDVFEFKMLGSDLVIGAGATVDFNTGPVLWHANLHVQVTDEVGVSGDLGLGWVLFGFYDTTADYTQIIVTDTWTVGDYRYTEYERIEGKCWAAMLHVIEAGVRPHYIPTGSHDFSDIIFYGGYRYASYYAAFMPVQEIEATLHGLLGIVYRDGNMDGIAGGVEAGFVWDFLRFAIGYYDEMLYVNMTFRLAFTFM
jgi:hypothetical protein